jgi:hypothetical protein
MTQNHLMIRNFSEMNKLTFCLMFLLPNSITHGGISSEALSSSLCDVPWVMEFFLHSTSQDDVLLTLVTILNEAFSISASEHVTWTVNVSGLCKLQKNVLKKHS